MSNRDVTAILLSGFYQQANESGIVRFCFAKQEQTLQEALTRLSEI
ncbi:aspartate/methionine/tyrosine aminotransferase [Undibacterium sp. GrIS 1.8]